MSDVIGRKPLADRGAGMAMLVALALMNADPALGHQDPRGDIHQRVTDGGGGDAENLVVDCSSMRSHAWSTICCTLLRPVVGGEDVPASHHLRLHTSQMIDAKTNRTAIPRIIGRRQDTFTLSKALPVSPFLF